MNDIAAERSSGPRDAARDAQLARQAGLEEADLAAARHARVAAPRLDDRARLAQPRERRRAAGGSGAPSRRPRALVRRAAATSRGSTPRRSRTGTRARATHDEHRDPPERGPSGSARAAAARGARSRRRRARPSVRARRRVSCGCVRDVFQRATRSSTHPLEPRRGLRPRTGRPPPVSARNTDRARDTPPRRRAASSMRSSWLYLATRSERDGRAGLDLPAAGGHGEVGDRHVLGLARAVRHHGACSRPRARSAIASSVSVSVPIWLTLMRIELADPGLDPAPQALRVRHEQVVADELQRARRGAR